MFFNPVQAAERARMWLVRSCKPDCSVLVVQLVVGGRWLLQCHAPGLLEIHTQHRLSGPNGLRLSVITNRMKPTLTFQKVNMDELLGAAPLGAYGNLAAPKSTLLTSVAYGPAYKALMLRLVPTPLLMTEPSWKAWRHKDRHTDLRNTQCMQTNMGVTMFSGLL